MPARSLAFMGSARDRHSFPPPPGTPELHLLFPGDQESVRTALKQAMTQLQATEISTETHGVIEIVLAEVLNNVVEHAYADHGRGIIEVTVAPETDGLFFRICDDGRPMPGGEMPPGHAHDLDVERQDLPEGGFGWFLIRKLTSDLAYRRIGNRNELSFFIHKDSLRHRL